MSTPPRTPHRNGLLFVCVGNSGRSQIAEGFARFIGPADMQYFSAGSAATELHPLAVKAMREVGIDLSGQRIKRLSEVPIAAVATIVTLCEDDECPSLPKGVHHLSWPIEDPGATPASEDEMLASFRRVRDQIRELVSRLF